jgi:D-arabinose 1-dehydrogenase-like Zn-dependent alcohol dehydrogenase
MKVTSKEEVLMNVQDLWDAHFHKQAEKLKATSAEQFQLYAAVKATLVSADWATTSGVCSFSSEKDKQVAISASQQAFDRIVTQVSQANERKAYEASRSVGNTVSAGMFKPEANVSLKPVQAIVPNQPVLASMGDRCNKCNGEMRLVALVNDQQGLLCLSGDNVVLPLAV